MTGQDLLNWLQKQRPATLQNCRVGFTGHFNEFFEMTMEPEVMEAKRDHEGRHGTMIVIKLEHLDIGPDPDSYD